MMNCRRIDRGALAVLLGVVLAAAGCGMKADPIPPRFVLPPAIADLTAESLAEGILLGWSAPERTERIYHFRILRGETNAALACPGCPQEYRPLATPKIGNPALVRVGQGVFQYVDADVTADRFYSYRVSACDSRGHCGEPSAPVGRLRERR